MNFLKRASPKIEEKGICTFALFLAHKFSNLKLFFCVTFCFKVISNEQTQSLKCHGTRQNG